MTQLLPPLLCALAAYLICRALTPWTIQLAPLIGAVDVPRDERRMHTRPVPRNGGLALFIAYLVTTAVIPSSLSRLLALLWGATLLVLLGIFDDIFHLRPALKLIVQVIAAAVALGNGGGWDVLPLGNMSAVLGAWHLPFGILWVVILINAHNMIDGLDGLAAGISTIESIALALLFFRSGDSAGAALALAQAGACLGFLHYNRHPACVFMGDTGSQLLGFLSGVLSLQVNLASLGTLGTLVPLLLFALPLSDLVFAVLRRSSQGRSPFAADRGHWHHRLMDAGLGQRRTCAWLSIFCASLDAVALLLCREDWYPFAAFALIATMGLIVLFDTLHRRTHT